MRKGKKMENIQVRAQKLNKAHRKHRGWLRVVSVLASITLFCTVYALIMPATTQSPDVYCGLEEHAEHSGECFETHTSLICVNEDPEHVHDENCYATETALACSKPVHVHSLQCYSNPDADTENEKAWDHMFETVVRTGDYAQDILTVATSQLKYKESERNYQVMEDGLTKNGYTRYGDWYGEPYGSWDAMFCSFCIHYADIKPEVFPVDSDCANWIEVLRGEPFEYYRENDDTYLPQPGDLIFFDDDLDDVADRVGIYVEEFTEFQSSNHRIRTIEGDSENAVSYCFYKVDDERIIGFAEIPENTNRVITDPDTSDDRIETTDDTDIPENVLPTDSDPVVTEPAPAETVPSAEPENTDVPESPESNASEPETDPADSSSVEPSEDAPEDNNVTDADTNVTFTATADDGIQVTLIAAIDSLPYPAEEITLTVRTVLRSDLDELLEDHAVPSESSSFYDICLMHDGEEIEPNGPVSVIFEGIDMAEDDEVAIHHVDPDAQSVEHMDAVVNEDGNVELATDHFSIYSVTVTSNNTVTNVSSTSEKYMYIGETAVFIRGSSSSVSSDGTWSVSSTSLASLATTTNYKYNNHTCNAAVVTALDSGDVTLTWKKSYSSDTCKIHVLPIKEFTVEIGETLHIIGSGGSNATRSWTQNGNNGYAQVSTNGRNATITGTAEGDFVLVHTYDTTKNNKTVTVPEYIHVKIIPAPEVTPVDPDDPTEETPEITNKFEHHKNIDYLGDGDPNPDTNESGEDLYRLYLDMTGATRPVDLLLVLDCSGSMANNSRATELKAFLNGSDGFLQYFKDLNPDNQISIVTFSYSKERAWRKDNKETNKSYYLDKNGWNFKMDAEGRPLNTGVLRDWGQNFTNVDLDCYGGTNYVRALRLASQQLDAVEDDGREKVMVFLSDGEPTSYIVFDGDDEQQDTGQGTVCTDIIYDHTIREIDTAFHPAHPNVTVYTVGYSPDAHNSTYAVNTLTHLAQLTGGTYFAADNADDLRNTIKAVFMPQGVTITDTLSCYVEYHTVPDVKVTMKTANATTPTVLYENGQIQNNTDVYGKTILDVNTPYSFDPETKTMTLHFDRNYCMNKDTIYTVSFNVTANQLAKDTFASSGYSARGDNESDYHDNLTSSNHKGFYSNDGATVSYYVDGKPLYETYEFPVVQVDVEPPEDDEEEPDEFILVEKIFKGISVNQIPDDFTITVNCGEETYSLTYGNDETSSSVKWIGQTLIDTGDSSLKDISWKWKIYDTGIGNYTVSESNCSVGGLLLTSSGDYGQVNVEAADFELDFIREETECETEDWPIGISEDSNVFFAAAVSRQKIAILTDKELSATQKAAVSAWFASLDPTESSDMEGAWDKGCLFYSIEEDMDEDGFVTMFGGRKIDCSESGSVTLCDLDDWTLVGSFSADAEDTNRPEIRIINAYSGSYELPHTGGPGTLLYTLCGVILIGSALMFGYLAKRKDRRKSVDL